jgi:hypothetical protein
MFDDDLSDPKQRPMILVADDVVLERVKDAFFSPGGPWYQALKNAVGPMGVASVAALLLLTPVDEFIALALIAFVVASGRPLNQVWEEVLHRLQQGELPFPVVRPEIARSRLRFDVGLFPQAGQIYLQHPCAADHYLQPATFDERIAREKVAAFKKIAADLGARKLTLRAVIVHDKTFFGGAKFSAKDAAESIGLGVSGDAKGNVEIQTMAEFGKPKTKPRLHPEHQVWVDAYPEFQAMVYCRLEQNLLRDQVRLEVTRNSAIEAGLLGRLQGANLDVGGKLKEVVQQSLSFEVEYW